MPGQELPPNSPHSPAWRHGLNSPEPRETENIVERVRPAFDSRADHVSRMHSIRDAVAAIAERELEPRIHARRLSDVRQPVARRRKAACPRVRDRGQRLTKQLFIGGSETAYLPRQQGVACGRI